jgi:hypothetical protein
MVHTFLFVMKNLTIKYGWILPVFMLALWLICKFNRKYRFLEKLGF